MRWMLGGVVARVDIGQWSLTWYGDNIVSILSGGAV